MLQLAINLPLVISIDKPTQKDGKPNKSHVNKSNFKDKTTGNDGGGGFILWWCTFEFEMHIVAYAAQFIFRLSVNS